MDRLDSELVGTGTAMHGHHRTILGLQISLKASAMFVAGSGTIYPRQDVTLYTRAVRHKVGSHDYLTHAVVWANGLDATHRLEMRLDDQRCIPADAKRAPFDLCLNSGITSNSSASR